MATATPSTSGGDGGAGVSATPPVQEVAAEVPFLDLCRLLERVSKASGTERKKGVLNTFIGQWRDAHGKLHPSDAKTTVSGWSLWIV